MTNSTPRTSGIRSTVASAGTGIDVAPAVTPGLPVPRVGYLSVYETICPLVLNVSRPDRCATAVPHGERVFEVSHSSLSVPPPRVLRPSWLSGSRGRYGACPNPRASKATARTGSGVLTGAMSSKRIVGSERGTRLDRSARDWDWAVVTHSPARSSGTSAVSATVSVPARASWSTDSMP